MSTIQSSPRSDALRTTSHGQHGEPAAASCDNRRRLRGLSVVTVLTAAAMSIGLSAPVNAAQEITLGSSGDISALQKNVSSNLGVHRYGKLGGPAIANAALVNIEPTVTWATVAKGGQDANIKRWAQALKGTGPRLVSFSHEPMSKAHTSLGNSSTFIAAWKHVVNVFNAQGATNVQWVWNVTSNSFRVSPSSSEYGSKWYPGDSYVDYVAGEAYNRYQCGTANFSFANRIQQIFAFAKAHHKQMVVAEFASNAFSGRADWIKAATAFMNSNRANFRGAFYYNTTFGSCRFKLSTSAEYSAFRAMYNTL